MSPLDCKYAYASIIAGSPPTITQPDEGTPRAAAINVPGIAAMNKMANRAKKPSGLRGVLFVRANFVDLRTTIGGHGHLLFLRLSDFELHSSYALREQV